MIRRLLRAALWFGARMAFRPMLWMLAIVYLAVDVVSALAIRPAVKWLDLQGWYHKFAGWFQSLGPYQTLGMFAMPFVVMEPIKPVGLWFIANGRWVPGIALLLIGGTLKVVVLERLFHLGRDKMLLIPAFAWAYARVVAVLDWAKSTVVWRSCRGVAGIVKATARGLVRIVAAEASWLKSKQNSSS